MCRAVAAGRVRQPTDRFTSRLRPHHPRLTACSQADAMRLGLVRSTVVVIATAAWLALPGVSGAGTTALQLDRGVVQSISDTQIELRALDGAVLTLTIGPATRLRLNGAPASLAQIRPGFVAEVLHRGARPAVVVRAFGTVPILVDRGVVTSLSRTSITRAHRRGDGSDDPARCRHAVPPPRPAGRPRSRPGRRPCGGQASRRRTGAARDGAQAPVSSPPAGRSCSSRTRRTSRRSSAPTSSATASG